MLSSKAVHPNDQKGRQKCQENSVDEQGDPSSTQTQNGSIQRVEARTSKWGEYRNIENPGIKLKLKWN